jgi:hypothetical protein
MISSNVEQTKFLTDLFISSVTKTKPGGWKKLSTQMLQRRSFLSTRRSLERQNEMTNPESVTMSRLKSLSEFLNF